MSFRAAVRADIPVRVLDQMLHAVAALVLPGPWWMQYLPDVMVPVIWLRSWRTDAYLPDRDAALRVHKALHLRNDWSLLLLAALVLGAAYGGRPGLYLFVSCSAHWTIDMFTHRKGWL